MHHVSLMLMSITKLSCSPTFDGSAELKNASGIVLLCLVFYGGEKLC